MTEALQRVLKQAEQLPEEAQLELARIIEQKLSEMRWDELLQRPESAAFLQDLEREAEDESALEDLRYGVISAGSGSDLTRITTTNWSGIAGSPREGRR